MPIDIRRVIEVAAEAALKQGESNHQPAPKKPRLPAGKALLLGAGAVTAGRLLAGPKARATLESLQHQLADSDLLRDLTANDESEDQEDFDEEPQAEDEEDFDEEYEDEPQAEDEEDFDEDYEDEPEADVDDDEPEDEEQFDDDEDDDRPTRRRSRARSRA
jgi:hypothetical protein